MTEALPRLLLVEDDAVSRQFLMEALRALPAEVDAAASIAEASAIAARHSHALWLVDAHLPDGDGVECLTRLRAIDDATPAVAITAETWKQEFDRLEAGGFVEVLQKPTTMHALQANVRRLAGLGTQAIADAPSPRCGKRPVWDDDTALAAVAGSADTLHALRDLFLAELPEHRLHLHQAQNRGDAQAIRALVHRLTASSGFVGAARLHDAVLALSRSPLDASALQAFDHAAEDTQAADQD